MENSLIRNHLSSKLGRNSPCPCGSGKKYKKCCLECNSLESRQHFLKQASIDKLRERNSGDHSIVADAEKLGIAKMSEVILEYADELLDLASTPSGMQKAILFSISAWNISVLDEDKRSAEIDRFLHDVIKLEKSSDQWGKMRDILQTLIEKRLVEYSSFNRFIIDYEFIQLNSRDFHLNVISSLNLD